MLEKTYGKYWQTVIDTMLEGLMLVDPDGKIVFINNAFEQLTGYKKSEVEGKSCEILGCDTCFGTRKEGKDKYCALFKEGNIYPCLLLLSRNRCRNQVFHMTCHRSPPSCSR